MTYTFTKSMLGDDEHMYTLIAVDGRPLSEASIVHNESGCIRCYEQRRAERDLEGAAKDFEQEQKQ